MKTTITFEVDTSRLMDTTDEQLACLWHVAQGNPAPHGDADAGALAAAVGTEIITRWLAGQPPRMHTHAPDHRFGLELSRLGDFSGPDGRFVPRMAAIWGAAA
jgi:hypothetical protein